MLSVCVCTCICVCRWEELNSLAEQRRQLLAGAEQVHRFVRDAFETNDRMNEKVWTTVCIHIKCIYVLSCIWCMPTAHL